MEAYSQRSATIGRDVEVQRPGGRSSRGLAQRIDEQGRLVVDGEPHASGDVIHLR
jgi:BirA family biotin operon repressor/biotin-[acetyl-CoA-carboxylase] ligase